MVEYKFNCLYCNHIWNKKFYSIPDPDELKCPQCKDTNIKKMKIEKQDVFGYNLPWKKKKDKKKDEL